MENKISTPDGTTENVNVVKNTIGEKEEQNTLHEEDNTTSNDDLNENGIKHLTESLISSHMEKISKTTDVTSLTKSSPSMLNKLADAIIAENFDALQGNKDNISTSNLTLSKDPGNLICLS